MASVVELPKSTQQQTFGGGPGAGPLAMFSSTEDKATGLLLTPTPHRPNVRHSIPPAAQAAPTPRSTFSIVIGSPPNSLLPTQSGVSGTGGNHYGTPLVSPSGVSRRGGPTNKPEMDTFGTPSAKITKRGRPFKNPQDAPQPQPIPKKRGRPFQTPEAAARAAAKAAARESSNDDYPKKRGRPVKYPQESIEVSPPEATFMPFFCEWEDCPAELHNLETLRHHLFTVHRKPHFGILTCSWQKCSQVHEVMDEATQKLRVVENRLRFKTKEEWRKHINEVHLEPIAWYMGDGPRGTNLRIIESPQPEICPSYLCDVSGQQLTPSVENQPIEEGRAKDNNAARFVKRREGLDIVLEPISPVEAYLRLRRLEDDDD